MGERSREIGISIALGGSRRAVVRSVVRQAIVPALWGVTIGIAGAGAITSALAAGLIGVQPLDPATFIGAALLLLACAAIAGYVPARRAARVDPVVTLRSVALIPLYLIADDQPDVLDPSPL